ncbi:MAG: DUF2087 domain-containing protein [Anaerolineae bacterium]
MVILELTEFSSRFPALVLSCNGALPNKPRDRQILFAGAVLGLQAGRTYSESQVNAHLLAWTEAFGARFNLDAVSLRRELVEAGYLARDSAGRAYRLAPEPPYVIAAPEGIDLEALVEAERSAREERRKRFSAG